MKRMPRRPKVHWSDLSKPLKLDEQGFADKNYLDKLKPGQRRSASAWALWFRCYREKQEAAPKKPLPSFGIDGPTETHKRKRAKRKAGSPVKVIEVEPRNKVERELLAIEGGTKKVKPKSAVRGFFPDVNVTPPKSKKSD